MASVAGIAESRGRVNRDIVPPTRPVPQLEEDVAAGLLTRPFVLPPKYFYDERGSRLFDRICETPEYYLTRTEDALLGSSARAIIDAAAPDDILELGSGMSRKTRRLLDACESGACQPSYTAFDIAEEALTEAANDLVEDYDWLEVNILLGDYDAGLARLPGARGRRLYCFLGSTIGNFPHARAVRLLSEIRAHMTDGDCLLLGADRLKDETVLTAAYNDRQGLTAAFNLNLLRVLNMQIGADFDLDNFTHRAAFNVPESRIEMRLVSCADQVVQLPALDTELAVRHGESILTEISRKFTEISLLSLLSESGFNIASHYTPDNEYFSLILARPGRAARRQWGKWRRSCVESCAA